MRAGVVATALGPSGIRIEFRFTTKGDFDPQITQINTDFLKDRIRDWLPAQSKKEAVPLSQDRFSNF